MRPPPRACCAQRQRALRREKEETAVRKAKEVELIGLAVEMREARSPLSLTRAPPRWSSPERRHWGGPW